MNASRLSSRVALFAAAAALAGMATMTACGSDTKENPADTKDPAGSSASQSPATLTPTEKQNVGSFAPTMTADKAPTRVPGIQGKTAP